MRKFLKFGLLFCIGSIILVVCLILIFGRTHIPLLVVSSNPQVRVSINCTLGTNHVYFFGDFADQVIDPLLARRGDTNANRLRCETKGPCTVVWARFTEVNYGINSPTLFQARLTDTNGGVTTLPAVNARLQHYQGRFYVMGWAVPGTLEAHRGSLIRIESTNGTEAVTLRVP